VHLLKAQAGGIIDGTEPVDLEQSPGDIAVLTYADTEIAAIAMAHAKLGGPSLRLANISQLLHNYSVDLYIEQTLVRAKLIVVRLLGGSGYWRYGLDEIVRLARANDIALAVLPGDARPDDALSSYSTLPDIDCTRLWDYLSEGGPENITGFLRYCAYLLGKGEQPPPVVLLPKAAVYKKHLKTDHAGAAAVIFYRALVQSGDKAPVDALIAGLNAENLSVIAIYITSLKDKVVTDFIARQFAESNPDIVLNLTGFAVGGDSGTVLETPDCPVLQVVLAGTSRRVWQDNFRGLAARDIAMNVAMPEVDGRILTRAISFKAKLQHDAATETPLVIHQPQSDRVIFTSRLAAAWVRLGKLRKEKRKIALVLANYPSSDGHLANGVGLDTPAATINVMQAMCDAGYMIRDLPVCGNALMEIFRQDDVREKLYLADYMRFFTRLPTTLQREVTERWGKPENDPRFIDDAFLLRLKRFGNLVVGIQPERGFNLDVRQAHHDAELVPPHNYLAFYCWLREMHRCHAIIHMGKHGNLEWLPGKAVALSAECYPEAALGPMPHIYPFIVNDPGEGTQAKRRTGAVIIDHLTPPLARADTYGPLKDLEALVDEYYEAANVDPRRVELLGRQIIDLASSLGLHKDCGITASDDKNASLQKLDNFLCDLKEMQIRDGLHVFGKSPKGEQLTGLLLALVRIPRNDGQGGDASLIRALAHDLGLADFDPLACEMGKTWTNSKPQALLDISDCLWRSLGDTVERLELLAFELIAGRAVCADNWLRTKEVLEEIEHNIKPKLLLSAHNEISALLKALDGKFVPPGPSGAPTRGRLDVLPTGRNFYSIDTRTVPTQAAWELGQQSAELLITAYRQEHGCWPKSFGISAWGTSNMRTGGDDIAQAMALIGARPVWEKASRRVTGFEIIPLGELQRPRIDVLFRISGFFRDGFPAQIDLLNSAIIAVAKLDEPEDMNPVTSGSRIFSSKPGSYGAGIKHLIKNGNWQSKADLAACYQQAGGYAYGNGREGENAHEEFSALLARLDAVVQNQDAREFDLLDSDDFHQFEGGMAAAVESLQGKAPAIFHNDHSNPERPVIRPLAEEISRIVRGRAVNPKWIVGQMRHGYKGAADMAQTTGNLFAFAATTGAVADHHFEALFEAYLVEPDVNKFLSDNNESAKRDIASWLKQAIDRGLWQPKRNSAYGFLEGIKDG
jgi:cobaltochelatase CobN